MKRLILGLVAALLLPSTSSAQSAVPSVFLGFTSATFLGGDGVLTFHSACAAEFPNSRMCTSEEILKTPTTPVGLSGTAWVLPVFTPVSTGATDASGASVSSPAELTCQGWSTSVITGLAMDSSGRFLTAPGATPCSTPRSIACCRPMVVLGEGDLNLDGDVNIADSTILRRILAGLPLFPS